MEIGQLTWFADVTGAAIRVGDRVSVYDTKEKFAIVEEDTNMQGVLLLNFGEVEYMLTHDVITAKNVRVIESTSKEVSDEISDEMLEDDDGEFTILIGEYVPDEPQIELRDKQLSEREVRQLISLYLQDDKFNYLSHEVIFTRLESTSLEDVGLPLESLTLDMYKNETLEFFTTTRVAKIVRY